VTIYPKNLAIQSKKANVIRW